MRFRVRSDLSRSAAPTEQGAYGFGSVDNIAVTHGLLRLSECSERLRVSLDLSGFPCWTSANYLRKVLVKGR